MMQSHWHVVLDMIPTAVLLLEAKRVVNHTLSKSHEFSRNYTPVRMGMCKGVQSQEKVGDGAQYPLSFGRARICGVDI